MKVIIGLGNPDIKYQNTRHNVGYKVVEELKSKNSKDKIFKSDKFMNNSGSFVLKIKNKYPKMFLSDLYIVHDDLDIPLGSYKIQFGKGPRIHNGINDVYEKLGNSDFWHVRVGVDNRDPENRTQGKEYVLEDFTEDEKLILQKVIKQICNQLVH